MNKELIQYFFSLPVHEMEDVLKQVSQLRYEQELGSREIDKSYREGLKGIPVETREDHPLGTLTFMKDGRKVGEIKDVKLVYPNALGVITNIEEPNEVNPPPNTEGMYGAEQVNQKAEQQGIPEFIDLMHRSIATHIRKKKDYASDENPFSNFERSAEIASWFLYDSDKSYAILVGTKLARIAELTDGRLPSNESLDDSFLDLVTYCALWGAFHKRFKTGSPLNTTA